MPSEPTTPFTPAEIEVIADAYLYGAAPRSRDEIAAAVVYQVLKVIDPREKVTVEQVQQAVSIVKDGMQEACSE